MLQNILNKFNLLENSQLKSHVTLMKTWKFTNICSQEGVQSAPASPEHAAPYTRWTSEDCVYLCNLHENLPSLCKKYSYFIQKISEM